MPPTQKNQKNLHSHTLLSLNSGNHLQTSLLHALFQPPVVLANPLVPALSSLKAWGYDLWTIFCCELQLGFNTGLQRGTHTGFKQNLASLFLFAVRC